MPTALMRLTTGVVYARSWSGTLTGGTIAFADGAEGTPTITNDGDTDTGLWFPADNLIALSTGGAERVRIDASGNVGIGTTAPGLRAVINGNLGFTTSGSGAGVLAISATAPTISSGFGTSASVSANNGTASFRIDVGTGGTASTGVIGLPTATTGWNCYVQNLSTNTATVFLTKQTDSSTTTATIGNYDTAGAAAAWAESDILACTCFAL